MLFVERLTKTYGPPSRALRPLIRSATRVPVEALKDVSFTVDAGEVVGLVGPNGAGKTTLVKIMSTLVTPSSGRVLVDGIDVVSNPDQARRRLGLALTDERGLYWRLTGRQNLEFFGRVGGLSKAVAQERADELLATVGLAERDKLVFGYSTGLRTRLNLARAVLWDPPVLVLDEPTRSLDPLAAVGVGRLLTDLARQGKAVFLSSHRLEEVAGLCDRVVVLVAGQVRYIGAPRDLAHGRTEFAAAVIAMLAQEQESE